jgi:nucleotide-binding universal stress UspA family protein
MDYKTILVHVDDSAHREARLRVALDLADRFESHLIVLYAVQPAAVPQEQRDPTLQATMERRRERSDAMAHAAGDFVRRHMQAHAFARFEFRASADGPETALRTVGRYADLVVLGQYDPDDHGAGSPASLVPEAMLGCARPTLIVPFYSPRFPHLGRNVLVAWDGGREAARAVRDALPLLARADQVIVSSVVEGERFDTDAPPPGTSLAHYLARHGVKVEVRPSVAAGELSIADELLARLTDYDIDLLVMGGFGHSRLRELILGGVTRSILKSMTAPVLMSH